MIAALAVDDDGALWVGTIGGGLARFHEGGWQVFNTANSGLPSDKVSVLTVGGDGALWVGTFGSGLARFHKGNWHVFTSANSDLPSDKVLTLTMDGDGALWVGTLDGGLARFHEGGWHVFTPANSDLPTDDVVRLAVDGDGALWVRNLGGGLARLHEGDWQVFLSDSRDQPSRNEFALAVDDDGALWVGVNQGLAQFYQGVWKVFTPTNSDLPSDEVFALVVDSDGGLWISTEGGLAHLYQGTWQVFTPANSNLPSDEVLGLTVDDDGALWIGTLESGLMRFHKGAWKVFDLAYLSSIGTANLAVDDDGALWTGTYGSGLARFDKNDWQVFTAANSDLPSNDIIAIAVDDDGALWTGTYGSGLARFDKNDWQVFTAANSDLPDDIVQALAAGVDGSMWAGTDKGLARLHEGTWQVFTAANGDLPDDTVQALAAGADGTLWVGTEEGLGRYHEGVWQVFNTANSGLPSDKVSVLTVGGDGALWVGTFGSGLARFHKGNWHAFTSAISDLPSDYVIALSVDDDGSLWIGTLESGLSRFHKGAWQVFTTANSDLPSDLVPELAVGDNSALWVSTDAGVARFEWVDPKPFLNKIETLAEIHQTEHTFAVRGFDPTYRTPSHLLRYSWTVSRRDRTGMKAVLTRRTSEPYFKALFPKDGSYTIKVQASDRYGWLSNTETFNVEVTLPSQEEAPWWQSSVAAVAGAAIPLLYLVLLLPLISLYPRLSWTRSLVNSGAFTRFPMLHRLLLNSSWARNRLFALYRADTAGAPDTLHYIDQSVFPLSTEEAIPIGHEEDPVGGIAENGRFSLILGRSGTGKTVLMMRIRRAGAERAAPKHSALPVLVNAPTHLAGGEALADAVKTVLRRDGKVELPDSILDFLIGKGGFLILVDSLNECLQATGALTAFLNADANNIVVIASQTDILQHPDVKSYRLAEITVDQAKSYLDERNEAGIWDSLSPPLQALGRNPMDLDLIAEVIENLSVDTLPRRRADLYAERLKIDTAIQPWVDTADPRLEIVYGLAWRMLATRRMPDLPTFAQWIKEELSALDLDTGEVDPVTEVLRSSRQFRQVKVRDRLGREQEAITFDHELVGKFLAARRVRAMLENPSRAEALELAANEAWQDVFFFVIDEATADQLPNLLLDDLIEQSGPTRLSVVAYAIKSKANEQPQLPPDIRNKYSEARLSEDVKLTPAA